MLSKHPHGGNIFDQNDAVYARMGGTHQDRKHHSQAGAHALRMLLSILQVGCPYPPQNYDPTTQKWFGEIIMSSSVVPCESLLEVASYTFP